MRDISVLLREVRLNYDDPTWLDENADDIYMAVKRYSRPQTLQKAFSVLTMVAPYYLRRAHHKRWWRLFDSVLLSLMQLGDEDRQQETWQHLGNFSLLGGDHDTADVAYGKALERAEDDLEKMDALIGLLHTHSMRLGEDEKTNYYELLLGYAKQDLNPYTIGPIYKTAAQYHMVRLEIPQAIGYAQTALGVWWQQRGEKADFIRDRTMGQCFLILGISNRVLGKIHLASRYIELALNCLRDLPHHHDYYMTRYERGIHFLIKQDFEQAENEFRPVIAYFDEHDVRYFGAFANYSLGYALTKQCKFDEAHTRLFRALNTWQEVENHVETARTQHAIGFLFMEEERLDDAAEWLDTALATCDTISVEAQRESVKRDLLDDIDTLNNKRK